MRAAPFAPDDLTRNAFLGGRVTLLQPRRGYRAGIDPVLLAAAVRARPGEAVLELGCGAAPGLCCLGARVPGLALAGLELQPGYAALARDNLKLNDLDGSVWEGDVADPPAGLRARQFDHVMLNPPYFDPALRAPATDAGRELALAGGTPPEAWIACAARRLKPGGTFTLIQRAERLPDLLATVLPRLGSVAVLPLLPREGRPARLILLTARKGGRAAFRLHAGLVLHDGARHVLDAEDYTKAIRAVLRDGAALPVPE